MNQEENQDGDQSTDNWFSSFENQCLEELESDPTTEEKLNSDKDYAVQQLWLSFQNSATAIAQLYKDRHQGVSLWVPFQNAAVSVTKLYRDSVERIREYSDKAFQCGRQNKTRDIVAWAKKKRRHIRREELIAYLCGRSPPRRDSPPLRSRHGSTMTRTTSWTQLERAPPRLSDSEMDLEEANLDAFREAIAIQGINGAMSNISVGYRPHGNAATGMSSLGRNNGEELQRFIHEEIAKNMGARKRTSSPDILIDSPSRKRGRLT